MNSEPTPQGSLRFSVVLAWCLPLAAVVFVLTLAITMHQSVTEQPLYEAAARLDLNVAGGADADVHAVQRALDEAALKVSGPDLRRRTLRRLDWSEAQMEEKGAVIEAHGDAGAGILWVSARSLDPVFSAQLANVLLDVVADDVVVAQAPLRGPRDIVRAQPPARPTGPRKTDRMFRASVRGLATGMLLALAVAVVAWLVLRRGATVTGK
jgi:hypothetical protein